MAKRTIRGIWAIVFMASASVVVAGDLEELNALLMAGGSIDSISVTVDHDQLICIENCPTLQRVVKEIDQHKPFTSPKELEAFFESLVPPANELQPPVYLAKQRDLGVVSDRKTTWNSYFLPNGDQQTTVQNQKHGVQQNKFFVGADLMETTLVFRNRTGFELQGIRNLVPDKEGIKSIANDAGSTVERSMSEANGERTFTFQNSDAFKRSGSVTFDAKGRVVKTILDRRTWIEHFYWTGYETIESREVPTVGLRLNLSRRTPEEPFMQARLSWVRLRDVRLNVALKESDFAVASQQQAFIQIFEPGQKEKRITLGQPVADLLPQVETLEKLSSKAD